MENFIQPIPKIIKISTLNLLSQLSKIGHRLHNDTVQKVRPTMSLIIGNSGEARTAVSSYLISTRYPFSYKIHREKVNCNTNLLRLLLVNVLMCWQETSVSV